MRQTTATFEKENQLLSTTECVEKCDANAYKSFYVVEKTSATETKKKCISVCDVYA